MLLGRVHEAWGARRSELVAAAERITNGIQAGHRSPETPAAVLPPAKLVDEAARRFAEVFDKTDGGFGRVPKFPQPAILELLLTDYRASGRAESLAMVRQTLDAMARGGMFNQVAGGFHRYSADRKWLVPHFEKMLYDNAQLLHAYARAYQVTGEGDFLRIAEQIADYVGREMTGPKGLFFSAQDSNVDGEEGRGPTSGRE